jgi:hypothetical protein
MPEKFDDWGARGPETELQSSTDDDPDDSLDSEGFEEGDVLAEEMGEEAESAAVESEGDAGEVDEVDATPADHSLTELDHALEDVIVNAMSAADSHGFVRRLAAGVSRIARATGSAQGGARGNEGAGQPPDAAARDAAPRRELAPRARRLQRRVLPLLQQFGDEQTDEPETIADLAQRLADEAAGKALDEALPLLAGMAAHVLALPLVRRNNAPLARAEKRELLDASLDAARTLDHARGAGALSALLPLARSVARGVPRMGLVTADLARAIRRGAGQAAAQPRLLRHLMSLAAPARWPSTRHGTAVAALPRRIRLEGPVEITILSR